MEELSNNKTTIGAPNDCCKNNNVAEFFSFDRERTRVYTFFFSTIDLFLLLSDIKKIGSVHPKKKKKDRVDYFPNFPILGSLKNGFSSYPN